MYLRGFLVAENVSEAGKALVPAAPRRKRLSRGGLRVPPPRAGMKVNFCKTVRCENSLVPPNPVRPYRKSGAPRQPGDYTMGSSGDRIAKLECEFCGEHSPVRSNLAVVEELARQSRYLWSDPKDDPSCPNPTCELHSVPLSKGRGADVRFGQTPAGTQRFRCKKCGGTFTGKAPPGAWQRKPLKNRDVFLLIVNKVPISRILETTGIGFDTFYRKLHFIHRQCQAFAGSRERRLLEGRLDLPKMYLCTDRQSYIVNWSGRRDRRTVQMNAIGTADLQTGYVFGMQLNFDERVQEEKIEVDATAIRDTVLSAPDRKYARLWLRQDYAEAVQNAKLRDETEKK